MDSKQTFDWRAPAIPHSATHHFTYRGDNLPDDPVLRRLCAMYAIKRPYTPEGGVGCRVFTTQFIMPVASQHKHWTDDVGNVYVDLRAELSHRTLFVAHTDSVHRKEGLQTVTFDAVHNTIATPDGECLGADDATGVALLLHMIEAGVPALYVFTVGEERGGVGSQYMAEHKSALLSQFDRAIAFDRRVDHSVITHQGFGRCCSDEFAQALADALMDSCYELLMAPDDTGVYTDTAEFVDLVPECTNISAGYNHEHTHYEYQDYAHFKRLLTAALDVKWDELPVERDPAADAYADQYTKAYGGGLGWDDQPDDESLGMYDAYEFELAVELLEDVGLAIDPLDLGVDEANCAMAAAWALYENRPAPLEAMLEDILDVRVNIAPVLHDDLIREWVVGCIVGGGLTAASASLVGSLAVIDVAAQDARTTH